MSISEAPRIRRFDPDQPIDIRGWKGEKRAMGTPEGLLELSARATEEEQITNLARARELPEGHMLKLVYERMAGVNRRTIQTIGETLSEIYEELNHTIPAEIAGLSTKQG